MSLLNKLLHFVIFTSNKYKIDESHGLKHSMDVLQYAYKIFNAEKINYPEIINHERIIYTSALVHDMCDKKYMSESEGISNIEEFLKTKIESNEIDIIKQIISTMSYSKVKKHGCFTYPDLGQYQMAYHIVREADLLTAYDIDRCIIYQMYKSCDSFESSFDNASKLFDTRVLKHFDNNLFITEYSKKEGRILHEKSLSTVLLWENILKNQLLK
jgi:HD superfamily phosphodiesterase